jgi:hypothetical protein
MKSKWSSLSCSVMRSVTGITAPSSRLAPRRAFQLREPSFLGPETRR